MPVSGGIATFSTLCLNAIGIGYTLQAADGGLTGITSSAFNITAGAANHLIFTQQPATTGAGQAFTLAPTVQVVDQFGNLVTTDSSFVTLTIGTNPGGGTLSGTANVQAGSGSASFPGLSINKTGIGYTLTATDGSLTSMISSAFNITVGAPFALVFSQQPTTTVAGQNIDSGPGVQVQIVDQFGNLETTNTTSVTVAISSNPNSGTLSGLATVPAVAGVATFSNLSIDKTGVGYNLAATDAALGGFSTPFNITPAAANKLAFNVQPGNTVAGQFITPVQVYVEDALGNIVTTDNSQVTMAIGFNAGGGTLTTTPVNAANGIANFNSNLSINKTGISYTLSATDPTLTAATSSTFNITPGAASQVVFAAAGEPTSATAGVSISPTVQVDVEDSLGNIVTGDSSSVSVAISLRGGDSA